MTNGQIVINLVAFGPLYIGLAVIAVGCVLAAIGGVRKLVD